MLSPPEVDLDYLRDKHNLPEADTGRWIFDEVRYIEWRESRESKLLWLCGGPGIGKTMLAKCVAAEFLKGYDDPPGGVKLVFHFISPELHTHETSTTKTKPPQFTLAKVAIDLLYGIFQQDASLVDSCKAELGKLGDKFSANTNSLWEVLGKVIRDCKTDPVYILIDGIDRLPESLCKELIRRILGLMEIRSVKIFLSSRNIPHITDSLPCDPAKCTKIDLDTNSFVARDVETFIRRRVGAWGWDVDLSERAIEALVAKSEGTFLWASLAMENLACLSSGPDFDAILEKPLPELQDLYRKMLLSLTEREGSEKVLHIIQNVALALRPLTFGEFGHILDWTKQKISTEQPIYGGPSSESRFRAEKEIRTCLKSSLGFLRANAETVSIVHHTAIEFLFDVNRKDGLRVLSKSKADLTISWECFRYLHHAFGHLKWSGTGNVGGLRYRSLDPSLGQNHQEEGSGKTPLEVVQKDPQEALAKWPFLRYAAESWFIHAHRSLEVSTDKFCDDSTHNWLEYPFFEASDVIRKPWIELCGDSRMAVLAGEQTPLHIAVCLGLLPLVQKVLSDSKEKMKGDQHPEAEVQNISTPNVAYSSKINQKNQSGNTPLHLAFQFNHTEIIQLLVKEGADPTTKNNAQLTASELGAKLIP